MPIGLTAETEVPIEQRMTHDAYGSPDDVVRAGLTALDGGARSPG